MRVCYLWSESIATHVPRLSCRVVSSIRTLCDFKWKDSLVRSESYRIIKPNTLHTISVHSVVAVCSLWSPGRSVVSIVVECHVFLRVCIFCERSTRNFALVSIQCARRNCTKVCCRRACHLLTILFLFVGLQLLNSLLNHFFKPRFHYRRQSHKWISKRDILLTIWVFLIWCESENVRRQKMFF